MESGTIIGACIPSLDRKTDTADLECHEKAPEGYLQRHVTQDIKRGVARIFIPSPEASPNVAGSHTLSAAIIIAAETLPEPHRKRASKGIRDPIVSATEQRDRPCLGA